MVLTGQAAPRRRHTSIAKISHITTLLRRLASAVSPRPREHVANLSAHYLRDIGLDAADLEMQIHKLPSQHSYHPRG